MSVKQLRRLTQIFKKTGKTRNCCWIELLKRAYDSLSIWEYRHYCISCTTMNTVFSWVVVGLLAAASCEAATYCEWLGFWVKHKKIFTILYSSFYSTCTNIALRSITPISWFLWRAQFPYVWIFGQRQFTIVRSGWFPQFLWK